MQSDVLPCGQFVSLLLLYLFNCHCIPLPLFLLLFFSLPYLSYPSISSLFLLYLLSLLFHFLSLSPPFLSLLSFVTLNRVRCVCPVLLSFPFSFALEAVSVNSINSIQFNPESSSSLEIPININLIIYSDILIYSQL